jgi:hypothetical protein
MNMSWLTRRASVVEAQQCEWLDYQTLDQTPVVRGTEREEWSRLLTQVEEGDELWEFCSPFDSWKHLAGRAGIALVRQGRCVAWVITMMN